MNTLPYVVGSLTLSIVLVASPVCPQGPEGHEPQAEFTLHEVMRLALERSPTLAASQGFLDEQRGNHQVLSAYPNPTFGFQSGRGTVLDPSVGISITERYVTMSQPLEWPGKRAAEQRVGQAGVAGAKAAFDEAKLNLTAEVKKAFYGLLLAERQQELQAENLETVEQLGRGVRKRVDAGEAPAFEALKVNVELLKIRRELARAQGAVRGARAELNRLTAGALGSAFTVQGHFVEIPDSFHPGALSEVTLGRHPAIQKLQQLVEESRHALEREQQARVPTFEVSGSYQRDAGREAFVGGLSIPLPLWNQRQGEIAKALGVLRQREARMRAGRHRLVKDYQQQVQHLNASLAQVATFQDGLLKQAREAVRIAQVSFQYGETSLLAVLDAERTLRQTLLDYHQAQFDLSVAVVELERLTGNSL